MSLYFNKAQRHSTHAAIIPAGLLAYKILELLQQAGGPEHPAHVRSPAAACRSIIAAGIRGRSGKSCRLRWCNQLNPAVKRGPFSEWEDAVIICCHKVWPEPLPPCLVWFTICQAFARAVLPGQGGTQGCLDIGFHTSPSNMHRPAHSFV